MTVWVVVLAVEALAVVVLLALLHRFHRRAGDAISAVDELGRTLAPALVALRADTAGTEAVRAELQRRSLGPDPQ